MPWWPFGKAPEDSKEDVESQAPLLTPETAQSGKPPMEFMVTNEDGIMLRIAPSQKAKRTGELLQPGEIFGVSAIVTAVKEPKVDDEGLVYWENRATDEACFLRLADGRGWALDRHPATQEPNVGRHDPLLTGCARFKQSLRGMFHKAYWEYSMMLFIIVNAVFIGLEIDQPHIMTHGQWLLVNSVFALCYLIEMSLKLYVFRFVEFMRSYWNVYDLLVTVTTLLGDLYVIIMFLFDPHHESSALSAVIPVLRLLRLLRIARLFAQLRLLLSSLIASTSPLSWIALFFGLWFYICACLCTVFIGRKDMLKDGEVADAPKLRAMFHNIKTSMYTLFEVMMMEGWIEVVRPLVNRRPFLLLFFLLFIFLSAFFLLNLVTSVVVDRTMQAKQEDEENSATCEEDLRVGRIGELYKALLVINSNQDLFEPESLERWSRDDKITEWLHKLDWDASFLSSLCELLDHQPSGEVSLKALREMLILHGQPLTTDTYYRIQIQVVRRMSQLSTQ